MHAHEHRATDLNLRLVAVLIVPRLVLLTRLSMSKPVASRQAAHRLVDLELAMLLLLLIVARRRIGAIVVSLR